jgi:hypothetical protein
MSARIRKVFSGAGHDWPWPHLQRRGPGFSPAGGVGAGGQGTRPGSRALFMHAGGGNNPRILLTSAVRTHRTCVR